MSLNTLAAGAATGTTRALFKQPTKADALAGLTKYVPTESITLYVATVSAQVSIAQVAGWITPGMTYWFFVALTPLLLLLLFFRELKIANKNIKIPVSQWPWWRMIASTIAFTVWAMAVPGNPIITSDNAAGGIVAGLAAILVSTFLNILTPFFEKS